MEELDLIMDVINSLLTLEAGASVIMVGALAIIVRSFLVYSKEATELQPKLTIVDKELTRLRENIEPKKKFISQLHKETIPLREKEQKFDTFFQVLKQAELDEEKKEVAEERENKADKKRSMQRRSMGFSGKDGI